jgi:hypothetical protein
MKQVWLIGMIYVKLLASCAPTTKDIRIFEQEQRSRELEEELEATLNFLKKTTTSIVKPVPQVIIISDSKEEVEVGPQVIIEE